MTIWESYGIDLMLSFQLLNLLLTVLLSLGSILPIELQVWKEIDLKTLFLLLLPPEKPRKLGT